MRPRSADLDEIIHSVKRPGESFDQKVQLGSLSDAGQIAGRSLRDARSARNQFGTAYARCALGPSHGGRANQ
jgi:hypothetical protein